MGFKRRRIFINSVITIISLLISFYIVEFISYKVFFRKYADSEKPVILVIGDSFCVASFSFPYLLEDALQNRYQVVNLSESGFGPDNYLMYLSLALKRFDPEIAIISVYLGNDILNLRGNVERLKIYLGSNFYSYHIVRRAYVKLRYQLFEPSIPKEIENRGVLNPYMIEGARKSPDIVINNLNIHGEEVKQGWSNFRNIMLKMEEITAEKNIPLLIVAIPESIQVSDSYQRAYNIAGFKLPEGTEDIAHPQNALLAITNPMGIPVMDLLQIFKKNDSGKLYLPNDPHLAEEGHRVLNNSLLTYLEETGLFGSVH